MTISTPSLAETTNNYTFACELEGSTRLVEVVYLLPDQKVPCEVRYQKNDEEIKVLWRADNQEGFCESHVQQLIKQLRNRGFVCDSDDVVPRPTASSLY